MQDKTTLAISEVELKPVQASYKEDRQRIQLQFALRQCYCMNLPQGTFLFVCYSSGGEFEHAGRYMQHIAEKLSAAFRKRECQAGS